jgi:hypothetical protein
MKRRVSYLIDLAPYDLGSLIPSNIGKMVIYNRTAGTASIVMHAVSQAAHPFLRDSDMAAIPRSSPAD